MDDRTIIQLSTPRITSALHVIRLSGEGSRSFLEGHTRITGIKPRRVYHRNFFDKEKIIDSVICFFFAAPHSYTGEDMVEIHTHGSLLIVDEILRLAEAEGCRLSLPGEFTYRAFLNGKIGLEQAEAIDGLIRARSDFQKQNALRVLQDKLSFRFTDLKDAIAGIQAELESVIEFPEEDLPEITEDKKNLYRKYGIRIDEIIAYFTEIYHNYQAGRKLAEGFRFVIIGSPNSGKSTLFNLLLREKRAIVSEQKGTTRDYISERYVLSEACEEIILYDTAGIHEHPESIEAMGIEKLPDLVAGADLIIWLISGEECYRDFLGSSTGKEILAGVRERQDLNTHLWVFLNKNDLLTEEEIGRIATELRKDFPDLHPSIQARFSLTSHPMESRMEIEKRFREWVHTHYRIDYDSPALLNRRQGDLVERILVVLQGVREKMDRWEGEEIVVEEIRQLNRDLKELSLETGPEEVYDLLFSRFCIGK